MDPFYHMKIYTWELHKIRTALPSSFIKQNYVSKKPSGVCRRSFLNRSTRALCKINWNMLWLPRDIFTRLSILPLFLSVCSFHWDLQKVHERTVPCWKHQVEMDPKACESCCELSAPPRSLVKFVIRSPFRTLPYYSSLLLESLEKSCWRKVGAFVAPTQPRENSLEINYGLCVLKHVTVMFLMNGGDVKEAWRYIRVGKEHLQSHSRMSSLLHFWCSDSRGHQLCQLKLSQEILSRTPSRSWI